MVDSKIKLGETITTLPYTDANLVVERENRRLDFHEPAAWLCTALLTHLELGVGLAEKSEALLQLIGTNPESRIQFEKALSSLASPNQFGVTELTTEDESKILAWLDQRF